jgi:hypothetical protein
MCSPSPTGLVQSILQTLGPSVRLRSRCASESDREHRGSRTYDIRPSAALTSRLARSAFQWIISGNVCCSRNSLSTFRAAWYPARTGVPFCWPIPPTNNRSRTAFGRRVSCHKQRASRGPSRVTGVRPVRRTPARTRSRHPRYGPAARPPIPGACELVDLMRRLMGDQDGIVRSVRKLLDGEERNRAAPKVGHPSIGGVYANEEHKPQVSVGLIKCRGCRLGDRSEAEDAAVSHDR